MRRFSRPLPLAAAAFALLAAGCGSTVQSSLSSAPGGTVPGVGGSVGTTGGGSGDSGLSAPGSGGSAAGGGSAVGGSLPGGSTAGGGTGSTGGTGTTGGTGPSGNTGGGGSGPVASQSNGPGVTATTINVGIPYDPDASSADAALGAANLNPGDTKAEDQAVVDYINGHGGIAGRKLNPIWYKASVKNSEQTTDQQMCAQWTQDNKTFLFETGGTPIMDQCAANEGAVLLDSGVIAIETSAILHQFPDDLDLSGTTIDDSMRYTINGLAKQGYFANGAKVGLVTWNDPEFSWSIQNAADPALSAHGLHNIPVAYITPPESYGDLGATSASVSNAVLKFRSEGINHVILFDGAVGVNSAGVLVLEWMQQAQSQHYFPKYGLNSTGGFTTLASDVPKQQMVGSEGVGWEPFTDLAQADYPPSKYASNTKLCLQIMSKAGQAQSSNNARGIQVGICDFFFFFKDALSSVKGSLNESTALSAINAIGTSYPVMGTFGININSQHHDGVELVRNTVFVPSCTCYRYTSRPYNAS